MVVCGPKTKILWSMKLSSALELTRVRAASWLASFWKIEAVEKALNPTLASTRPLIPIISATDEPDGAAWQFAAKNMRPMTMHSGASQMPASLCPTMYLSLFRNPGPLLEKLKFWAQFYSTSAFNGKDFYR
jgi:hypothetical protein